MICQRCGTYMDDEALTCEHCGTLLSGGRSRPNETGVRAMRQGRQGATPPTIPDAPRAKIPEYGDYEMSPLPVEQERSPRRKVAASGLNSFASRPTTRRGVPVNPHGRIRNLPSQRAKLHNVTRHPVNWMLITLAVVLLLILAFVGYLIFMKETETGQRITARKIAASRDETLLALARSKDDMRQVERAAALKELDVVPAQSYWAVGQEYMNLGDVENAIHAYQIADLLAPENYDGLLLLANAYELNMEDDLAEEIYLRLMKDVAPSRDEAYAATIRMYLDQNRKPEAADMMQVAYKNTDRETYRLQRKDFIPLVPQVDLPAGRYMLNQVIHLTSPQDYDIYYTLDDELETPVLGEIPEGWIFVEDGTMHIPEGTLTLRAFCVSENLTSDILSVTYVVFYPSPAAPYANLAPNTYDRPLTVSLRPGNREDEKEHAETPFTFYYTIDGSTPTEDSPIFDGTPIKLPSGRVTLRAVCVNKYGKMSSILEIQYKFNTRPELKKAYSEEDRFTGFTLNVTSIEEFRRGFGEPKSEIVTQYLNRTEEARRLEYDWGYAVFMLSGGRWGIVYIEMDRAMTSPPRGVGFGSTEDSIVTNFRDMGQLQSANGNRGLYFADPEIGRIVQNADGTRMVQYRCKTLGSKIWVLEYYLKSGQVSLIRHYYQP